jgi:hypothetical protein
MIADPIRTIIIPILLLAVVVAIGIYYNREAFIDLQNSYSGNPDPTCKRGGARSAKTGGICTGPNEDDVATAWTGASCGNWGGTGPCTAADYKAVYNAANALAAAAIARGPTDDDPYLDWLGYLRGYAFGNTNSGAGTTRIGSNITSNCTDNATSSILNNILSNYGNKLLDNSTADLTLDINYDGREDWPEYTSHEHEEADEMQDSCVSKREIESIIKNELASKLGRTTGNQMYYDDEEAEAENDDNSPAIVQGSEHTQARRVRKCPTIDTNQYVRKDSIPCWGCDIE